MEKDNTSQSYFARNLAVNSDTNFAECGSFWYQLLKGKTRQAAKAMSKMPILSSVFTSLNNIWDNIYNKDNNLYITNKEHTFLLEDAKLLICENARDSLDLNKAINLDTSIFTSFTRDSLKKYLSKPDQFVSSQSILLLLPFDTSTEDSDLKDLEIFTIQTWNSLNQSSTSINQFTSGVHFRQSEKYVGFLLPFSMGLNLSHFADESLNESARIDSFWNFFVTHFQYDGITGSFIFNAKVRGQNKKRKSIYNAILGLNNIPVGIEAQQASNYVKGSDQSVENFGKTLNAMFGGTAVSVQCDITKENIEGVNKLGNGFYAYKLINVVQHSYQGDTSNKIKQFTIVTKGKTNLTESTTLYPGDYLVNPINVYYNNGEEAWWDPSRTEANVPGACWTTPNMGDSSKSRGLPFKSISSSWDIVWKNNGYWRSAVQQNATAYITPEKGYSPTTTDEGYKAFSLPGAKNGGGGYASYGISFKNGVDWSDSKLQYIMNDYKNLPQIDWFFKYIIPNAVIIEINVEVLSTLYDNISKILNAIQQAAISICPISMLPIFKINKGNYQWVDPQFHTPES